MKTHSQSRRGFLITAAGSATGLWLMADRLARMIEQFTEEERRPYLVPVDRPAHTLYASEAGWGYRLTLDMSANDDMPRTFTWADWLERAGVAPGKPRALRAYLRDHGWDEMHPRELRLEQEVPECVMDHYIEGEFCMRDSGSAQAFHYLSRLDLGPTLLGRGKENGEDGSGEALGELDFQEGVCPGNNTCLVLAKDNSSLACLQQRLLALGESVQIIVES